MNGKEIIDIFVKEILESKTSDNGFSAVVTNIRSNQVVAFTREEIIDEIQAAFGGRLCIYASGEVKVVSLGDGESSNIGRIFNTAYEGRKFSRIEDVLTVALDMALEEIMVLRDEVKNNGKV